MTHDRGKSRRQHRFERLSTKNLFTAKVADFLEKRRFFELFTPLLLTLAGVLPCFDMEFRAIGAPASIKEFGWLFVLVRDFTELQ